jgi:AraC family transcriptional regulator of adaptative response / DNA-3-methyladenine glycosylase II
MPLLGDDLCYTALESRDSRFDGQFFVGVASTGVYCRPVCTARTPRRRSCTFFPSAAAAENAGFRPCLRCRPELAPGHAQVDAPQRLAHAAAFRIDAGELTDGSLSQLAASLGVTDRHLRRVFAAEFGVSPLDYAQTQRLLLAKRLLTDTRLSVTDVAMSAGFGSVRRFNALFRHRYRMAPGALRRVAPQNAAQGLTFELGFRPPYAWDAILAFLGARTIEGVELVTESKYQRTVSLMRGAVRHDGWLAVDLSPVRHALRVSLSGSLAGVVPPVLGRVKRLFDLACCPDDIARHLGVIAVDDPGLRVPGAFDGFELAVRAVLGQQVTVRAARTLAGRVAREFGTPVRTGEAGLERTFPSPSEIERVGAAGLGRIGVTMSRAKAIMSLAASCVDGRLNLDPGADVQATIRCLVSIPGIGDWTAQYVAMRALAWPDAFPAGDYGVRTALNERSVARVRQTAEAWRPWRAYAVLHLWRSLERRQQ